MFEKNISNSIFVNLKSNQNKEIFPDVKKFIFQKKKKKKKKKKERKKSKNKTMQNKKQTNLTAAFNVTWSILYNSKLATNKIQA